MDLTIPDKLYFKIGEVATLTKVKPHVLRYWETEFKELTPSKSRKQQRLYTREDIELVLRLKTLLYDQGFTIAGARKALHSPASDTIHTQSKETALIGEVRKELAALQKMLQAKPF